VGLSEKPEILWVEEEKRDPLWMQQRCKQQWADHKKKDRFRPLVALEKARKKVSYYLKCGWGKTKQRGGLRSPGKRN